jgi:hypothetical protein
MRDYHDVWIMSRGKILFSMNMQCSIMRKGERLVIKQSGTVTPYEVIMVIWQIDEKGIDRVEVHVERF